MRNSRFIGLALVLGLLVGCGDSSGGSGQCGSFTACGGNIVGTWQITGTCFNAGSAPDAGATPSCTTDTTSNLQYKGSFTFRSDATYSIAVTMTGSSKFTVTAACLDGLGMTCEELSSSFAEGGGAPAGVTGSCSSASGGGCACTENFNSVASPESGTYTTSGSTLVTTPVGSSAAPTTADYCVQGNRLTLRTSDTSGSGAYAMITATR